ncbi:GNAT family N-acetyltransferase [Actinocorallia lasiicapitis]
MPRLIPDVLPSGTLAALEQPVLKTEGGLLLRPFTEDDAPVLVETYTDPLIQRWHARRLDGEDEARALIAGFAEEWAAEKALTWAITDGERFLGRITVRPELGDGVGEIAYWAHPAGRGRGAVPQAVRAVTSWAFDLGFHRLFLYHSVHNEPSCRAAEKAGYAFEGVQRSAMLHADGWHDMHVHAVITGRAAPAGE